MSLVPHRCSKHQHFYLPCYRCRQLSQLYKCPEPDFSRIQAIQKFVEKYPDIEGYNEVHAVFYEWSVDDMTIEDTIETCDQKVERLLTYPPFSDVCDMFQQTSEFLGSLLQINNNDTVS